MGTSNKCHVFFGTPEENLDKAMKTIQQVFEHNQDTINRLITENNKLKDAAYKDNELADMKKSYNEMQEDYWRGFPISKEEKDFIDEWTKDHLIKKHSDTYCGVIGGRFTYEFTPTSIGVVGKIKCICGEEFTFQDL